MTEREIRNRRTVDATRPTASEPIMGLIHFVLLLVFVPIVLSACAGRPSTPALPGTPSPVPGGGSAGLLAGFGRADITPPPGIPLAGNGFEGRQAQGYRQRLHARALVLEDGRGQRLALVVADLPHVSVVLHRRTARAIVDATGVGADRLLLSATHTHSGPGNHYGWRQYNAQAGPLPGFDERLTDFLVEALSRAVLAAFADRRPARAGWGFAVIPGVTRNRSIEAHRQNPGREGRSAAEAVDDTLRMLRVEQCDDGWRGCAPRGAYSLFAVHGTVLPPANPLFDADLHGVVARELEEAIDGGSPPPAGPAVHLVANANEGDVSPAYSDESRCGRFRIFRAGLRPSGPRTPEPGERWMIPPADLEACLGAARADADSLGEVIATAAAELFRALGTPGRTARNVLIGRAFRTVALDEAGELCEPRAGVSSFGGADDARTRLYEWRLLGIDLGIEEGGSAAWGRPRGCQGHKKVGLGLLQDLVVRERGLPTHAQLGVYHIGDGVLAAVPAEATTEAGLAMRRAVADALAGGSARGRPDGGGAGGPGTARVVGLVGLANGYLQYVTTEPEYALQHYEGGSTLYGPGTASFLTSRLAELAADLARGREAGGVDSLPIDPGPRHSYWPPERGPDPGSIEREIVSLTCGGEALTARWIDLYPGRFRPAEGPVLQIRPARDAGEGPDVPGGGRVRAIRDGTGALLVRAVQALGRRGYLWEAAWTPEPGPPAGEHRFELLARQGMRRLEAGADCPGPGPR